MAQSQLVALDGKPGRRRRTIELVLRMDGALLYSVAQPRDER